MIPQADISYQETLKRADTMLYNAKEAGRNRVVWFDEKLGQQHEK